MESGEEKSFIRERSWEGVEQEKLREIESMGLSVALLLVPLSAREH